MDTPFPVLPSCLALPPSSLLVCRGVEPQWALPVPGGAVHTAGHRVSRLCNYQGGSPRRGCAPRPAVPQDHGGQQIKPRLDSWTFVLCSLLFLPPARASAQLWYPLEVPPLPLTQTACLQAEEGTGPETRGLSWPGFCPHVTGNDEGE